MAQELDEKRPQRRLFNQTKGEPEAAGHIPRAVWQRTQRIRSARQFRRRFDAIEQILRKVYGGDAARRLLLRMPRLSFAPGVLGTNVNHW
jgi:hypothetical protein